VDSVGPKARGATQRHRRGGGLSPTVISFVVPCFNEEDNVEPTVETIRRVMAPPAEYEIILVDDHSLDRTLQRMQSLAEADPRVRVVHNPVNLSMGGAYKRGVAVVRGTHVIMVPGDNGFPAASIGEVLRHIGEADIVIPVVTNPWSRTWFRALASRGFTLLLNWLFWLDVGYYNGAVLQRTVLLRSVDIKTNGFAYQAEALVKLIARGASYTHCRVPIQDREAGHSTALSLKNQITVWKTIGHLLAEVGLFRKFPLRPRRGPVPSAGHPTHPSRCEDRQT
jgi:dolichol-phosphate mannosyltransferase